MPGQGRQDGAMGNSSQRRWNLSMSLRDGWIWLGAAGERCTSGSRKSVSKIESRDRCVRGNVKKLA